MRNHLVFPILAAVLAVSLLAACSAAGPVPDGEDGEYPHEIEYGAFSADLPTLSSPDAVVLPDYELVADNGQLQLYYQAYNTAESRVESAIAVRDRRSGQVWYSSVPEETFSGEARAGTSQHIRNSMRSMVLLDYILVSRDNLDVKTDALMTFEPAVSYQPVQDGLRILYEMEAIGVHLVLEVRIEDDGLVVTVPHTMIRQEVGARDFLEKNLASILDYTDQVADMLADFRSEPSLRGAGYRRRLSDIQRANTQLATLAASIRGPTGISAIADTFRQLLVEALTLLRGGVGMTGLNQLVATDRRVDDDVKKRVADRLEDIHRAYQKANLTAAKLKTYELGSVTGLQVLPFFGAATDAEDGYVFYPDGSGAISRFRKDRPTVWNDAFSGHVYSETFERRTVDIDWERIRDRAGMGRIFLPVYGIRKGMDAFLAVVTQGDAISTINYQPSGYLVALNRAFAGFEIRNIIESAGTSGLAGRRFERTNIPTDLQVRFLFLDRASADYSGMAVRYRTHLLETGGLAEPDPLVGEAPITLDLLMGIRERRLLSDPFIAMTTFDQAAELLESLHDQGAGPLLVNLHGWTEEGYDRYPADSSPARALGGARGLRRLSDTAERTGARLYLQDNYLEVYSRIGRYRQGDLAMGSDGRDHRNRSGSIYLFSPAVILDRFQRGILPRLRDTGADGVTFDRLGTLLYLDYRDGRAFQKADAADAFSRMLSASGEAMGSSATIGGNAYVLPHVDWIMGAPVGATNYLYADEEIPFYQMVIHGHVTYSSSLYNQFFDRELQTLQMIEYGTSPFFRLTWAATSELKNTGYDLLFSSEIGKWQDDIVAVADAMRSGPGALAGVRMVHHERVGRDQVVVRYENGTKVLINYGSESAVVDGVTVGAMSYGLVQGGDGT